MAFDADTGRLDVVPDAPAVGTKLRWSAPKRLTAANKRVPNANARALHVLAPAPQKAGPGTAAADLTPQSAVPVAPGERRTPPDGYRHAIEAHCQAVRTSRVGPATAEVVERQTAAMRALSQREFPEPDAFPDDAPAPVGQVRTERRQAAATEAAALRRARAERAARHAGPVAVAPGPAPFRVPA
ncbi:DUF721 domain-containing protein [Streptomyces yaizuensis]|uniref:Uncharacterized protein n=1 Tax=Streptomyces yaizuensis TaxID=2989713 RepID=A0ABQ5PBI5_9ACTN|nr:DUF721 domain-containing protein [Streptomyces sp. YSPA8]GLF99863.1 hypothetical protein SYYSPA8_36220 [Streptomyces sp. YSPA8]